jgi:hypothetical protein
MLSSIRFNQLHRTICTLQRELYLQDIVACLRKQTKFNPVSTQPTGEIDYETAHKKYLRSNRNQFQFDGADTPNFKQYHQINIKNKH